MRVVCVVARARLFVRSSVGRLLGRSPLSLFPSARVVCPVLVNRARLAPHSREVRDPSAPFRA